MGKKDKGGKGKGKGKGKKHAPDIDYASDEHFNPVESLIYLEHETRCFVYDKQKVKFEESLREQFPYRTFHVLVNRPALLGEKTPPRDGSFEIWLSQNARCERELLWSGVARGPPRRFKFPSNYAQLWPQVKQIISRYYKMPGDVSIASMDLVI